MPFQGMAAYDIASQVTLAAVKAKTDFLFQDGYYRQLLPRRGKAVAGTWAYANDAGALTWLTDVNTDLAGIWYNTTTAQNDEYSYPVFLRAGTYNFEVYIRKFASGGIISLYLGTTFLGTIDTYAAASTYENISTLTFVLAADTAANLRLVAATKNVASLAYQLTLQKMTLWRQS